jgi:hypothetical protein
MASTMSFFKSLAYAGCPGVMCKADWVAANKHQYVCEEDLKL